MERDSNGSRVDVNADGCCVRGGRVGVRSGWVVVLAELRRSCSYCNSPRAGLLRADCVERAFHQPSAWPGLPRCDWPSLVPLCAAKVLNGREKVVV